MTTRSIDHSSSLSANFAEPKQRLDLETEELQWIAEVIVGDPRTAESCIASGLIRADGSVYVAHDWRDRWLRRCVAQEAVEQTRSEINRIIATSRFDLCLDRAFEVLNWDRNRLRSLAAFEIWGRLNAFERTALILHLYLNFSAHDCALLIDCHWSLIEHACSNALWLIFGGRICDSVQSASAGFQGVTA